MENKKNLRRILGMLLVFGFMLVGCDNGTTSNAAIFDGVWGYNGAILTLSNGNFEMSLDGIPFSRGGFSTSGNNITFHGGQFNIIGYDADALGIAPGWYSRNALISALQNSSVVKEVITNTHTVEAIYGSGDSWSFDFSPSVGVVSGNTLNLEGMIFTKGN